MIVHSTGRKQSFDYKILIYYVEHLNLDKKNELLNFLFKLSHPEQKFRIYNFGTFFLQIWSKRR